MYWYFPVGKPFGRICIGPVQFFWFFTINYNTVEDKNYFFIEFKRKEFIVM